MGKHLSIRYARASFALAFLVTVSVTGWKLLPACRRSAGSVGIRKFPAAVQKELPSRFPYKHVFVDLNGGACRAIGRRLCNERILFKDGMLGYMYMPGRGAVGPYVDATADFARRVEERGVSFLYVQLPGKFALDEGLMPEGVEHYNPNEEALQALAGLVERGVRTLDLVRVFATTRTDVEANFFRTDHHWRGRAAFEATGLVARELAEILGDPALREPPELDIGNWEKRTLKQAFLGSHGRRTGRWFAGIDDFEYFTPKFETDIQRYRAGKLQSQGDFEKSVLDVRHLSRPIHVRNAFGVFGSDRNEEAFFNGRARSKARILVVKDSFANPMVGFLSTVCRDVMKVDPRKFSSPDDAMKCVEKYRPDAVVMVVNPTAVRNERFRLSSGLPVLLSPLACDKLSRTGNVAH